MLSSGREKVIFNGKKEKKSLHMKWTEVRTLSQKYQFRAGTDMHTVTDKHKMAMFSKAGKEREEATKLILNE